MSNRMQLAQAEYNRAEQVFIDAGAEALSIALRYGYDSDEYERAAAMVDAADAAAQRVVNELIDAMGDA